jgi:hypothetical protein
MSHNIHPSHSYQLDPGAWHSGIKAEGCLGWAIIIFSPFISFAIHGTVGSEGLKYTVFPLVIGFAMMITSSLRVRRERQKIPKEILEQSRYGKLFPALPKRDGHLDTFLYESKKRGNAQVTLDHTGVWVSAAALQRASWKITKELLPIMTANQYAPVEYIHHVAWNELVEWQVSSDSDGPDYYTLCYQDQKFITLSRPYGRSVEPALLDYVRSVGQCPVRLFCNAG